MSTTWSCSIPRLWAATACPDAMPEAGANVGRCSCCPYPSVLQLSKLSWDVEWFAICRHYLNMLWSSRPVQLHLTIASQQCYLELELRNQPPKVTAIQKWMKPSPPVLFSLQAMSWEVALNPSDKVGRCPVVNLGLDGWKNSGLSWWLTKQCFRLWLCLSDSSWQIFWKLDHVNC